MEPRGFFSYARGDDEHLGKMLSELKTRLAGEVSMLLGRDIDMFQDIHDLRVGDDWKMELRAAIAASAFLVPVLTPRYFTREWCREETLTFLKFAKEQGVTPYIFPILFVPDRWPPPDCSVRAALAPFQFKDFTQWRFSTATERVRLENAYAEDVAEKLYRLTVSPPTSTPTTLKALHNDATPTRGGWVSDLLRCASRDEEPVPTRNHAAPSTIDSLASLAANIASAIDDEVFPTMWDRYRQRKGAGFTRRLYTVQGTQLFEQIQRKYQHEDEFRAAVDRYIADFEQLLIEASRSNRDPGLARNYLFSDQGKVYTMLAHASGRLD